MLGVASPWTTSRLDLAAIHQHVYRSGPLLGLMLAERSSLHRDHVPNEMITLNMSYYFV